MMPQDSTMEALHLSTQNIDRLARRRYRLFFLAVALIVLAGVMAAFAQQRPRKIAGGGEDDPPSSPGPLPPCVTNSMCAQNGRSCVPSSSGSGCCPNRDGTCSTAQPQALFLDGGHVIGWFMVRYLEEGTLEATISGVSVAEIFWRRANVPEDMERRGYWQIGLYVLHAYGQPMLRNYGEVQAGDFLNDRLDYFELVPAEEVYEPRTFRK